MKTREKTKERKKNTSKPGGRNKQLALVKKQYDRMMKDWMMAKY